MMGNMVTNVCAKFNYDLLRIDKVLENWNNNNNKSNNKNNNFRSDWGPVSGPKMLKSSESWNIS